MKKIDISRKCMWSLYRCRIFLVVTEETKIRSNEKYIFK